MLPSIPAALDDAGAPDGSVAKKDAATVPVDSIVPVLIPLVLIDVDPNVSVHPIVAFDVTFKPVPDGLLSVSVSAISAVELASRALFNVVIPSTVNAPH